MVFFLSDTVILIGKPSTRIQWWRRGVGKSWNSSRSRSLQKVSGIFEVRFLPWRGTISFFLYVCDVLLICLVFIWALGPFYFNNGDKKMSSWDRIEWESSWLKLVLCGGHKPKSLCCSGVECSFFSDFLIPFVSLIRALMRFFVQSEIYLVFVHIWHREHK